MTRSQSTFLYVRAGSQDTIAGVFQRRVAIENPYSNDSGDRLLRSSINLIDFKLRILILLAFFSCSIRLTSNIIADVIHNLYKRYKFFFIFA
jgi:hypothetical protein